MKENLAVMINNELSENVDAGMTNTDGKDYFNIKDGQLFKVAGKNLVIVANFYLVIAKRCLLIDEGCVIDQMLDLKVHFKGSIHRIRVSAREFQACDFITKIWEEVGPTAILYGSRRDLVIATQKLSGNDVPVRRVLLSGGLAVDGFYYGPGMKITAEGIFPNQDVEVDLSGGNFSRCIGFMYADAVNVREIARHIYEDFLNLKAHDVTFPLIGHACLAPFSSFICGDMGKRKSALHLEGPSGSGKTMLALLAMSLFGNFRDHFMGWTSTANAIEREGFFFKDCMFLIDDLKASVVAPETVVRILQNYVDGHGRARMKSNGSLEKSIYIRGLLLSTGEDFVDDVPSICGRTIVLNVKPEKNTEAGLRCLENRHRYPIFMPGLIHAVISDPSWKVKFADFVDEKAVGFHSLTGDLPNGLRISLNWSLNYLGFSIFTHYLGRLGIIDDVTGKSMMAEYEGIIHDHLQKQADELAQDDPVSLMFDILRQKLAAGQVSILNFGGTAHSGKTVGTANDGQGVVRLHPDILMEVLSCHYRSLGQRVPFSKKTLRDALAEKGLIVRSAKGRWTHQVCGEAGSRFNAWEFEINQFKAACDWGSNIKS